MSDGWHGNAAATTVDITPERLLPLAGSTAAQASAAAIEDRLEASLLLLAGPAPVLLVSVDALFAGPVVVQGLRERLAGTVRPEAILVFATHTHSAPALDPTKPRLGVADPAHVADVAERLAVSAHGLLNAGTSVELRVASTRELFGVCRRRRQLLTVRRRGIRLRPVVQGTDASAPIDDLITFARFDRPDGSAAAIVWSMACHPVGHPRPGVVSAHYPGIVRARLRAELGDPHLPVLFLQGFSGDSRPREAGAMQPRRSGLARLAYGPGYGPLSAGGYTTWSGAIAERVAALASASQPAAGGEIALRSAGILRDALFTGAKDGEVGIRNLSIGGGFGIVGVEVEAVAAYAAAARAACPAQVVIAAGCMGDVPGYAPTQMMLGQGGYEVEGFCPDFGIAGVAEGVEAALRAGIAATSEPG
jgi:hypothetical protein